MGLPPAADRGPGGRARIHRARWRDRGGHPAIATGPRDEPSPGLLRPWRSHRAGVAQAGPRDDVVRVQGLRVVLRCGVPERSSGFPGGMALPQPTAGYEGLLGHVAFYPGLMDRCTVDDEMVLAQPGDFYGGWITSKVTGPFKGALGTYGW